MVNSRSNYQKPARQKKVAVAAKGRMTYPVMEKAAPYEWRQRVRIHLHKSRAHREHKPWHHGRTL